MSKSVQDRNLLVGVIALQLDLISRDQLIQAMQAWILDKDSGIENLLVQQGALDDNRCRFLTDIAEKHLELHGNKAEQSLAQLSSLGSVQNDLMDLQDSEMTQTLNEASELRKTQNQNTLLTEMSADFSADVAAEASRRFRILRPHAEGGLGVVSVAEDRELNRQVAFKQIKNRMANDGISRSRFMVEAEVTGRLEHPGIVPVYSLGTDSEGSPFYAMRFIQGDSLKDKIRKFHRADQSSLTAQEQSLRLRSLIKRLVDVCDAIEYAHSRGVLHRDLKPGNIMLGKYGETLVVDWGLARVQGKTDDRQSDEETLRPVSGSGSTETRMGTVVGTVAFMSPEQARGALDELGPKSDVYSLGATLYSILTGGVPIKGDSPSDSLRKVKEGDFPAVAAVSPKIDAALGAICHKAMSLQPGDRYESAAALGQELDLWLAGEPVTAYREPLSRRIGRVISRHQTAFAGLTTFCVVALVALAVLQQMTAAKNEELRASRDRQRSMVSKTLNSVETGLQQGLTLRAASEQLFRGSVDELRALHAEDQSNASVQRALAESLRVLALQETKAANAEVGATLLEESLGLHAELLESPDFAEQIEAPQRERIIKQLIATSSDMVVALRQSDQYTESRNAVDATDALIQKFSNDQSMSESSVLETASRAQCVAAGIHMDFEDWEAAESMASASHEGHEKLFQPYEERGDLGPANANIYRLICIEQLGASRRELGQLEQAEEVYREGFAILKRLIASAPKNVNYPYLLARLTDSHSQLLLLQNSVDESALAQQVEAVAEFQSRVNNSPGALGNAGFLGRCQCTLARCYAASGDGENAAIWFRKSVETLRGITEKSSHSGFFVMLADALRYRVSFCDETETDKFDRAADWEDAMTAISLATQGESNPSMERLKRELTELKR